MSEKVLYLLGAGASAEVLPLVKDSKNGSSKGLPTTMREVADYLKTKTFEEPEKPFVDEFIQHLCKLADESERFSTIDTYAKHLYLTNRTELEKLKITLSLYFTIEQIYFRKIDKRYLIFLTTILERTIFPDNVKILTWNYDFQMELTGYTYWQEEINYDKKTGVTASKSSLFQYYPPAGNTFGSFADNANPNEFQIVHLNGIAGIYNYRNSYHNDNIFIRIEPGRDNTLQEIIKHYLHEGTQKLHLLTFAWERQNTDASDFLRRKMLFTESMVADTTILVIIGYSFPYFNREIDRQIFCKLRESGKLKKIYFQDPVLDGSFLKSQFSLHDIDIEPVKRTETFFVPQEL